MKDFNLKGKSSYLLVKANCLDPHNNLPKLAIYLSSFYTIITNQINDPAFCFFLK